MKTPILVVSLLAIASFVGGCSVEEPQLYQSIRHEKSEPFTPVADAGIKRDATPIDPEALKNSVTAVSRENPFTLHGHEVAYENSQHGANLLATQGWYSTIYEEKPEAPSEIQLPLEDQPARRLVGVMRGETVEALIDMGDGKIRDIRPGQVIEPGVWMVRSIDEEKAILERVKKDARPTVVVVRLSPNLGGGTSGGGSGGGLSEGNGGGNPFGGNPSNNNGGRRGKGPGGG